MSPRLGLRTLPLVPASAQPAIDPAALQVGIVHLGIGAFHRAHQAVYTQEAVAASGDSRWGICGITQRSARVAEQLVPQDCLYTVLTRDSDGVRPAVIGSVRQVLPGADRPEEVVARIADPAVRVVTLTVTEKGYRHDPATRRLRRDDDGVLADAAAISPPQTVLGRLVRGLEQRMRDDAGPVSVVSCDNLPSNGALLSSLVNEFVEMRVSGSGALPEWIASNVQFPSTMVDRIVPATTAEDRAEAARLLGVSDEGVVVAEPFRQWVIEDSFAAGRPRWELAGATITDDVTGYERIKLRLLNGSHTALAALGSLDGCETMSDAVSNPGFAAFARALMDKDITPTLSVPAGFDIEHYKSQLLVRFANPALHHRLSQVATDGSQKLPQRLLEPIRELRRSGAEPHHALMAVAAWMRAVTCLPLDDPLADRLQSAVEGRSRASDVVDALLGVSEVFGDDLRDDATVRRILIDDVRLLERLGAADAVASLAC